MWKILTFIPGYSLYLQLVLEFIEFILRDYHPSPRYTDSIYRKFIFANWQKVVVISFFFFIASCPYNQDMDNATPFILDCHYAFANRLSSTTNPKIVHVEAVQLVIAVTVETIPSLPHIHTAFVSGFVITFCVVVLSVCLGKPILLEPFYRVTNF